MSKSELIDWRDITPLGYDSIEALPAFRARRYADHLRMVDLAIKAVIALCLMPIGVCFMSLLFNAIATNSI